MIVSSLKLFDVQNRIISSNATNFNVPFSTTPFSNDKFEISFNGLFETSANPARLEQAQNISGIHCPACGVKMLSQEDYEKILKKAENAKTPREFTELLRDNQKYIQKQLRGVVKDSDNIENLDEIDMIEYYRLMQKAAYKNKQAVVHNIRDNLKLYTEWLNLPQEINDEANDIISSIHTMQNYGVYKNIVENYIKVLHLHDDKANQIRMNAYKPVVLANDYFMVFQLGKPDELDKNTIAVNLAKNLFSRSVSCLNPMDKYSAHEGLPNNQVLICANCERIQSKNHFMHDYNAPKAKNYINNYLSDIAYLIGHNKIEDSQDYILAFSQNMTKITRGKISFDREEIQSLRNLQHSASRHEIFAPIQQSKVDIPCAECGSILLTHEMRVRIEDEMKECKNLEDYVNLLQKYKKYVGKYARPYAGMFIATARNNPNISKEEFLKIFKSKTDNYAYCRLKDELDEYRKHRSYYLEEGTPEQLKNYDLFNMNVTKYINSRAYLDDELITYYNRCLKPLDLDNAPVKAIYMFTTAVKKVIFSHRIATSENIISNRKEDPIYTIVFNIFKMNVATADHLQATSKGGADTKDNLVALCKTCNKIKSQKDVRTWIIDNRRIKYNMEKQMSIIDKMAKDGQIENFDNWAYSISNKLYELSEGKIDLREQFKK